MHLKWTTLFLYPLLVVATVVDGGAAPQVQMASFEVNASRGFLDSDIAFDRSTKKVQKVVVTWAGPESYKSGIRAGDVITLIDDRATVNLRLDQVSVLLNGELKPGEKRSFWFEGKRGLFRRPVIFQVTFVGSKNKPNQAPEPTATSVTSRAAHEPRQP